ncbi:MAG TPA: hypothetical protein VF680_01700 [Allosphingosinicella sp.]|jgi:hypothetical protein
MGCILWHECDYRNNQEIGAGVDLLLRELPEIVQREWRDSQRPMLLSQLGGRLSEAAKILVRTENVGLKRLIETHLSAELRLVPMPSQGGGVVPRAETEGMSDEELNSTYTKAETVPNYEVEVFNAFKRHVSPGTRRFLILRPSELPLVRDQAEDQPAPESGYEIRSEDLAIIGEGASVATRVDTHHAIEAWCQRAEIDPKKLYRIPRLRTSNLVSEPTPIASRRPPLARDAGAGELSGLVQGLNAFTQAELARIQIPGDVLLSLLERLRNR